MRWLAVFTLVACGSPTPPPTPVGPPARIEAMRAGTDDVIVARVDGRPVWGSCVVVQARRTGARLDQALRQCIDFELLAQAAEKRGLATHPDVIDQTKTALVNQLVARTYEARFDSPGDFGPFWDFYLERTKRAFRFKHGEYRASTYVRIPIKDPPPADDPAKHALADQIAAALANERGLLGPHVRELAERVVHLVTCRAGEYVPCTQDVPLIKIGALDDAYGDALWKIPEVGRASAAVRTSLGWDVIVWTAVEPAATPSPDELARDLLPEIKSAYFANRWIWTRGAPGDLAKQLGVHVAIDPDADARLEALP